MQSSGDLHAEPNDADDKDPADDYEPIQSDVVGISHAVHILMNIEMSTKCDVPRSSVYGAAIALVQIARSAHWPLKMTALAARSYLYLILNYAVVYTIIYEFQLQENVMRYYSSRPHLCNFGKNFDSCEAHGGPDCHGPGGTNYTVSGLYSQFNTWDSRVFIRDSLKKVFPEREQFINEHILPGEFGMESPLCRVLCVFLFIMQIVDELHETGQMAKMLWHIPTCNQSWIVIPTETTVQVNNKGSLNTQYRIRGMSFGWKLLNLCIIIVPKFLIWVLLAINGGQFLMETADIQSVILNCIAMNFLLQIDELIASRLCTVAMKDIMGKLSTFYVIQQADEDEVRDGSNVEIESERWSFRDPRILLQLLETRLILIICLSATVYGLYVMRFCEQSPDGSYVSEALYPPKEFDRSGLWGLKFIFSPNSIPRVDTPTWAMPPPGKLLERYSGDTKNV